MDRSPAAKQRSPRPAASMWGTPQRSRRTLTAALQPLERDRPARASAAAGGRASARPPRCSRRPARCRRRRPRRRLRAARSQRSPCSSASRPAAWSGWPADSAPSSASSSVAGRRPSASSFCRWASITIAASGAQLGGDVVPGLGEQGRAGALAALEGGEQAPLAHLAVLDVLGELRGRVGDPGAVAGADQLDRLGLEQPQRVHVGGERAAVGRDEGRALAEHQVAAEADAVGGQEADVVGGVAGGGEGAQAGVLLAVGRAGRTSAAQPLGARRRDRRGEWVSRTSADPAPLGRRGADRLAGGPRRRARGRSPRRGPSRRGRCWSPPASSAPGWARRCRRISGWPGAC